MAESSAVILAGSPLVRDRWRRRTKRSALFFAAGVSVIALGWLAAGIADFLVFLAVAMAVGGLYLAVANLLQLFGALRCLEAVRTAHWTPTPVLVVNTWPMSYWSPRKQLIFVGPKDALVVYRCNGRVVYDIDAKDHSLVTLATDSHGRTSILGDGTEGPRPLKTLTGYRRLSAIQRYVDPNVTG